MSKKTTEFQRKAMSRMYRGKEIFKPLNTGWIDKNVACVREWVANIFFYCKDNAVIMIDAGYNYDRLAEKMGWLGIDPQSVQHILITHQDTDHVGAVEADSPGSVSYTHLDVYKRQRCALYQSRTAPRFSSLTRSPPWSIISSISSSSGVRSFFSARPLPAVLTMISIIRR